MLDPNYAASYRGRGRAYQYKKDFAAAIANFDKALELDPGNTNIKQWRNEALAGKLPVVSSEAKGIGAVPILIGAALALAAAFAAAAKGLLGARLASVCTPLAGKLAEVTRRGAGRRI